MGKIRLSTGQITRGKGRSAVQFSSYISGERLFDEHIGQSCKGKLEREQRIVSTHILAPPHAPDWVYSRERLWNEAGKAEDRYSQRADRASLGREILLNLPNEMTDEQRRDLVFAWVRDEFVSKGLVADIAFHTAEKWRGAANDNEHAHVFLTTREIGEDGEFSARKARWLNDTASLRAWRASFEDYAKQHMDVAGLTYDRDFTLKSHKARGPVVLDLYAIPEPKMGPVATKMERQGRVSYAGEDIRRVKSHNAQVYDFALAYHQYREQGVVEINPSEFEKQLAAQKAALEQLHQLKRFDFINDMEQKAASADYSAHQRRGDFDRLAEDQQRLRGYRGITDPDLRFKDAYVKHFDPNAPLTSMSKVVDAEYVAFAKKQAEWNERIVAATNPEDRMMAQLGKQIEGAEYMAITSGRLEGISKAIGGTISNQSAELHHQKFEHYTEMATDLRQQRLALASGKMSAGEIEAKQAGAVSEPVKDAKPEIVNGQKQATEAEILAEHDKGVEQEIQRRMKGNATIADIKKGIESARKANGLSTAKNDDLANTAESRQKRGTEQDGAKATDSSSKTTTGPGKAGNDSFQNARKSAREKLKEQETDQQQKQTQKQGMRFS